MSGQVRVNSADLVTHAAKVDGIGDGLTLAQRAGAVVRTDAGAYGQLCQFVPALINLLHSQVIDGIETAAGSAHDTADALRSVAAAYDSSDSNAAERLRNTR
ncbi:type VII secretion target [Actinoplanes sp. CA-030573]|uniref:type VII secretion target n=1 Tax=Actinoplanes sp. CA-030573 TaxID=3239898 RepID=UPI003D932A2E